MFFLTLDGSESIKMYLKEKILELCSTYFNEDIRPTLELIPGKSYLPSTSKYIDAEDLHYLIQASLDMWFTAGRFAREFESSFAKYLGLKCSLLVNSGSSANLLAIGALKLNAGDEVITAAVNFPTTVNPIIQNGLIPKFIDSSLETLNPSFENICKAITPHTKAIVLSHTLGNPWEVNKVKDYIKNRGIYIVEDCCDALGSTLEGSLVGSFGDIATSSFYPAHHITMGEGGAVSTNNKVFKRILESLRDWGRDCWCEPGDDNTCGKRFEWQLGNLPKGYDHKYIYSHMGYNLKATDMQAAIGLSQLKKLDGFIQKRKENWRYLNECLISEKEHLSIVQPTFNSDPSWFGFAMICKPQIDRKKLISFLENHKIGTRLVFGGNILRQPAYSHLNISKTFPNADIITEKAFWVGIHPRFSEKHLDYISEHIKKGIKLQLNG